jgi:hypothetical protein
MAFPPVLGFRAPLDRKLEVLFREIQAYRINTDGVFFLENSAGLPARTRPATTEVFSFGVHCYPGLCGDCVAWQPPRHAACSDGELVIGVADFVPEVGAGIQNAGYDASPWLPTKLGFVLCGTVARSNNFELKELSLVFTFRPRTLLLNAVT